MAITLKQISGWKWDTLEEAEIAEASCTAYYEGHINQPDSLTNKAFNPIPNYNSEETVTFYYLGYNKQMEVVLGPPSNFDISRYIPD